jgi:hypothetical protein
VASANANLTSGEKMSVAFGKIAKAIASLISHLADKSNPHGVTASQIGAMTSSDVVDSLSNTSTTVPLSAKQGKVLDNKISQVNTNLSNMGKSLYETITIDSGTYAINASAYSIFLVEFSASNGSRHFSSVVCKGSYHRLFCILDKSNTIITRDISIKDTEFVLQDASCSDGATYGIQIRSIRGIV